MNSAPLRGLIAATITPFRDNGSIDLDAIGPMLNRLIDIGVAGFYVCGSTGEGMSLTNQERKSVVEASVDVVAGRVPVIVQVGHNSVIEAKGLAAHAAKVGADVISATCPSYFKVNDPATLVELHGGDRLRSEIVAVLLLPHSRFDRIANRCHRFLEKGG